MMNVIPTVAVNGYSTMRKTTLAFFSSLVSSLGGDSLKYLGRSGSEVLR